MINLFGQQPLTGPILWTCANNSIFNPYQRRVNWYRAFEKPIKLNDLIIRTLVNKKYSREYIYFRTLVKNVLKKIKVLREGKLNEKIVYIG